MARGLMTLFRGNPRLGGSRACRHPRHQCGRVGLWVLALVILGIGGAAILYTHTTHTRPEIPPARESSAESQQAFGIDAQPALLRDFNVLLITMDTTRADHLHAYGNANVETPHLDGLAREGVRFAQAITPSPSTLPSHSSIHTGLYPFSHGARSNGTFRLGEEAQTLAETLKGSGYQTGAAISAFVLDRRFGLSQGFDDYNDDLTKGVQFSPHMFRERPAEVTNEVVFEWLDAHARTGKFFYWVHYFDPHAPYFPPEPFRSQYADDHYTGEIAYTDAQIGKLLEKLEAIGVRDRTLVILSGDHGEGLGEHGEMTHAMLLYDSTLHVPLIYSAPPPFPQHRVVETQVTLADVMPTILDLVGVPAPPDLDGISLLAAGPSEPRALYIENLSTQVLHGWAPLLGVRRDDHKFIQAPIPELYDLRGDPGELVNEYEADPVLSAELQARLRDFVEDDAYMGTAAAQNLPLDPETEALLRSLGYVFTAKEATPSTPDSYHLNPKDMVAHWGKVQAASNQHIAGDVAGAIRNLEQALEEVPDDIWARTILASAYQTYGENEKAYEMIKSVEERQPDTANNLSSLGSVLLMLNRVPEAEESLKRALELEPRSGPARLGLARIAERRHDDEAALALLNEVIEIDPGSSGPAAYNAIGRMRLRKRELDAAREAFWAAIEIDRLNGPAYDGLASVLIEEDRSDEAIPFLEVSLRFRPAQPQTLVTLAQVLRDRGELERAVEVCERALAMSPKLATAHNTLGRIYRQLGDNEKASELYRNAMEYAPHFDAPHVNLAQLLLREGREDDAMQEFRAAVRLNPFNYIALANLGVWTLKNQDPNDAVALFSRAIRVREDYPLAHKYLGLLRAQLGEPEAAAHHLSRSLELDANQPEATKMRQLLVEMQQRTGTGG